MFSAVAAGIRFSDLSIDSEDQPVGRRKEQCRVCAQTERESIVFEERTSVHLACIKLRVASQTHPVRTTSPAVYRVNNIFDFHLLAVHRSDTQNTLSYYLPTSPSNSFQRMFTKSTTAAALGAVLLTATSSASAQIAGLTGLSSSCTSTAASFVVGDLGSCLSLTSLLPVFSSSSGSVIPQLDSYLNTICSSSPCSNSTLSSAETSLASGCSAELSSGNAIVEGLDAILMNYNGVRNVACLQSSSNNSRCLTQTLYAVQNATGDSITVNFLESLISGNSTDLSSLVGLDSNVLCTECVKGMYQQAVAANATVANSPVASAISSKCGSNFACESTHIKAND